MLEKECKGLSVVKLVSYMEKQKSNLRKLKQGVFRRQKQEEARVLNQKFQTDASSVRTKIMISRDIQRIFRRMKEREMFNNIEETSEYWRTLWERDGTGDRNAAWLEEIRSVIHSRVPPLTQEDWDLEVMVTAKVLNKKKNWSVPGPDRLANFWWKRAHFLHEGVTIAFPSISRRDEEYSDWFAEGKTSLIPMPGEFSSDNQRLITCLNTLYK